MRGFLARFSRHEASNRIPSLVDFITITPELSFRYTHRNKRGFRTHKTVTEFSEGCAPLSVIARPHFIRKLPNLISYRRGRQVAWAISETRLEMRCRYVSKGASRESPLLFSVIRPTLTPLLRR